MRALIIIAGVVLLLVLVGWVTISRGPDRSSINVETNEIKKDTRDAVNSGAEMLDDAKRSMEQRDTSSDADSTSREPAGSDSSPDTAPRTSPPSTSL